MVPAIMDDGMYCMMSQELFVDLRLVVFAPFFPRFFVIFPVSCIFSGLLVFDFWPNQKSSFEKNLIFFSTPKNCPSLTQVYIGSYSILIWLMFSCRIKKS